MCLIYHRPGDDARIWSALVFEPAGLFAGGSGWVPRREGVTLPEALAYAASRGLTPVCLAERLPARTE